MKIIPMPIKRFLSDPKKAEFIENTFFAVTTETTLKMLGRPTFIMMDKEADSEAKRKYAAAKEFLYQGLCLALYVTFVPHIKQWLYEKISNHLKKNPENKLDLELFEKQYQAIKDMHKNLKDSLKGVADKAKRKEIKESIIDKIMDAEEMLKNDKRFSLGKGAKEISAIVASVAFLAILAPQISHYLIHPCMRLLGFDKADKNTPCKPS